MKHSDFTAIRPANDNPKDDRQGEIFPPVRGRVVE